MLSVLPIWFHIRFMLTPMEPTRDGLPTTVRVRRRRPNRNLDPIHNLATPRRHRLTPAHRVQAQPRDGRLLPPRSPASPGSLPFADRWTADA